MQYIKLFDSFNSLILSNTLKFISDKKIFLSKLKSICDTINFPYSELSDDYFEYLPFNDALYRFEILDDEKCTAESIIEFKSFGIKGEVCNNGRLKRVWGKGTRNVICPLCNGTGIKAKKPELKLVKFWFTSTGEFVTVTAVDGVIRNYNRLNSSFSTNINDYEIGDLVNDLSSLTTGTMVMVDLSSAKNVISYIIRDRGNSIYAIQDKACGISPASVSREELNKIAPYSWLISGNSYNNMRLLTPISKNDKVDPYTWNASLNINYGHANIVGKNIIDDIKKSNFAIIMDFGKIKKSKFNNRLDLRIKRDESIKGSIIDPNMSNYNIKKTNIDRYLNKIISNINVKDIPKCKNVILRSCGYRNVFYLLYKTSLLENLNSIMNHYYSLIFRDNNDENYSVDSIKSYFTTMMINGLNISNRINNRITELRKKSKDDPSYIEFFDLLDIINSFIYDKINNMNIETIEDMEALNHYLKMIISLFKNNRYRLSDFNRFIEHILNSNITDKNVYNHMREYLDIKSLNKELNILIEVLKKL